MAVLLRVASSCGRVAVGSVGRVRCGIESSKFSNSSGSWFQDVQEASFSKSKSSAGFSGDMPARCQAVAALHPIPTRQSVGILERPALVETKSEPETRPATIDQRAEPLPRSFLAESVSGNLVECASRGSRPLYTNVLAEFQQAYTGTSQTELVSAQVDITAVKTAFQAALDSTPGDARLVSEFAMFTWKSLGDVDAAEELYNKALELAPHDSNIQACHALFLWQCDE